MRPVASGLARRSPGRLTIHLLSMLFAAAPIVAALIRALGIHHDLRMLWMALASLFGASAVMVLAEARVRAPRAILALACLALVLGTLLAAWTAYRLGATAAAGIWLVSLVLAGCWAASFALDALSRPRTD